MLLSWISILALYVFELETNYILVHLICVLFSIEHILQRLHKLIELVRHRKEISSKSTTIPLFSNICQI